MSSRIYLRDGRAPVPKNDTVSRIMSANPDKGTVPEIMLRKALWRAKMRGYRINAPKLKGRPDIVFSRKKIAIFVNGCFWHRCRLCKPGFPKINHNFWKNKFEKNIARDKKNISYLRKEGWRVIVVWECRLKKDIFGAIEKIETAYSSPV